MIMSTNTYLKPSEAIINGSATDGKQKDDKLNDLLQQVHSKEMKTKIKPMLEGYLHIFRTELPNKPANIEPMKFTLIEESDWYTNRNKQPQNKLLPIRN